MPVVINEFEVVPSRRRAATGGRAAAAAAEPRRARRRTTSSCSWSGRPSAPRACARTEAEAGVLMPDAPLIASARPAIAIDGAGQAVAVGRAARARRREDTAGLYRCEAAFGNWGDDGRRRRLPLLRPRACSTSAKPSRSSSATRHAVRRPHHGARSALPRRRGRRASTVLAEDRFQDLRMTRRTRTFADVTDADVFDAHRQRPRADAQTSTSRGRRTRCSPR